MGSYSKRFYVASDEVFMLTLSFYLTAFQHATRSLQAFCNDMKVSKESVLISLVPVFKRTLETIFFEGMLLIIKNKTLISKVKNLCEQNGVLKAFWVGNLKQKNFLGQNVK